MNRASADSPSFVFLGPDFRHEDDYQPAMTDTRYTALVLAASRGNLDPLAQAGGVSHKCFIDIAGEPMLRRVVRAVAESGRVGRIVVAIEQESMAEAKALLAPIPGAQDIVYVPSKANIGTSVTGAVEAVPDAL